MMMAMMSIMIIPFVAVKLIIADNSASSTDISPEDGHNLRDEPQFSDLNFRSW
jgi:hypothetical protein